MPDIIILVLEILCAAIVAALSYRLDLLTKSGAVAAFCVGSIVFVIGGVSASAVLIVFFVVGSLLAKLPKKESDSSEPTSRDWKQVLANGAIPSLALLLQAIKPELREWTGFLYLGAFAAMLADTSATEIGTRFGGEPISIATFKKLPIGESGGITVMGLVASLVGVLVIVLVHYFFRGFGELCQMQSVSWALPVIIGGIAGSLADSWLGATAQAKFHCDVCNKECETLIHCDQSTGKTSGVEWIDNNAVNLIASLVGGIVAIAMAGFLN